MPPHRPWFAFFVLALLCASGTSSARHRNHASDTPGEFDYYLLSLSWSPAFCLESPGAAECGGLRRYGFIVHGLWPQNERGWPEHCDVHVPVPDEVVQGIADLMPARALVYHEWSAHGTCSGCGRRSSLPSCDTPTEASSSRRRSKAPPRLSSNRRRQSPGNS